MGSKRMEQPGDDDDFGFPIPWDEKHALSVSLPTWRAHLGWGYQEAWALEKIRIGYPRFRVHDSITSLSEAILTKHRRPSLDSEKQEAEKAILVPNVKTAERCVEYIKNQLSDEQREKESSLRVVSLQVKRKIEGLDEEEIELLRVWTRVVAVCFEADLWPVAKSFWQHFGEGFSSRRADFCRGLWDQGLLVEVDERGLEGNVNELSVNGSTRNNTATNGISHEHERESDEGIKLSGGAISFEMKALEDLHITKSREAKEEVRNRIAEMYFSNPSNSSSISKSEVKEKQLESVILYPTGMSCLAAIHRSLLEVRGPLRSICFGFPYVDTFKLLSKSGPGCLFYGYGTASELDEISSLFQKGERFLALFCEVPTNPLRHSPDLEAIQKLCRKWDVPVVVDDTLSTAINVDLLGGKQGVEVDMIWTSLSKSFSGVSNVMGGSIILNPRSKYYDSLQPSLRHSFIDTLHPHDALVLSLNSRAFLTRIQKMNTTSLTLAKYLNSHPLVKTLYYPFYSPTKLNYDAVRREDGGYGFLMSILFHSKDDAILFLDSIEGVRKGPNLGTDFTLVSAYTLLSHARELEWAEQFGVVDHLIRVSVGVEDGEVLMKWFREAMDGVVERNGKCFSSE